MRGQKVKKGHPIEGHMLKWAGKCMYLFTFFDSREHEKQKTEEEGMVSILQEHCMNIGHLLVQVKRSKGTSI